LRRHQEDFEKCRNTEMLEVQRMEAAEKRREEEMKRRLQQQAAQREQDLSMMKKVVARSIASAHLSTLKERALGQLRDAGVFADSIQLTVDNKFMPQLLQMVSQQMQDKSRDRQLLSEVMQSAVAARVEKQNQVLELERRRLATIDDAERQAREEIAENRKLAKLEEERIAKEKDALLQWESFVPEKPVAEIAEEFAVAEFKAEEKIVVLANSEAVVKLPTDWDEDQIGSFVAALSPENLEGGKRVMATLAPGAEEGVSVLADFRVAEPQAAAEGGDASADA